MSLVSRYLDPALLQRLAPLQLSARSVAEIFARPSAAIVRQRISLQKPVIIGCSA